MRYEEKMMQPFYKIGKWIASKMVKKEDVKYQKLEQTLQFVENSAKEKDAFEFTARRIAKVMMILFWGTGLCFLAAAFTGEAKEITFLARPSYGQGSMETDLEVQVEGEGEAQKIPILLQERQYSDQQIDEFFQQAIEDLESVILGENGGILIDKLSNPKSVRLKLRDGTDKELCTCPTDNNMTYELAAFARCIRTGENPHTRFSEMEKSI